MNASAAPAAVSGSPAKSRRRVIGVIAVIVWAAAMLALWVTPTIYQPTTFDYSPVACRSLSGLSLLSDARGPLDEASSVERALTDSWIDSVVASAPEWADPVVTEERAATQRAAVDAHGADACDLARENRQTTLLVVGIAGLAGIALARRNRAAA